MQDLLTFEHLLFACALITTTILCIFIRKQRAYYVAAPILLKTGIITIALSAFISCNANNSCNEDYIISYIFMQEFSSKQVSGRLYFFGYYQIWYALNMLILYPFYRRKWK